MKCRVNVLRPPKSRLLIKDLEPGDFFRLSDETFVVLSKIESGDAYVMNMASGHRCMEFSNWQVYRLKPIEISLEEME